MATAPAFRFTIHQTGRRLFEVSYAGYMPADDAHLRKTENLVNTVTEPVGLYYDCSGFTGFERAQVKMHGELFKRLGAHVVGIAVVGAKPVVRFGAITVSLLSNTPLQTFSGRAEALTWLRSLGAPAGARSVAP